MRPFDTYRASLVAGDDDALLVRKVTNDLEITVAASQGQDPFVLTAITPVRQIAEEFGEDGLRDTLEVAMVWADHNRFRADLLKGIAEALDSRDKVIVLGNARKWVRRTPSTARRTTTLGVADTARSATLHSR
jgi:hypothetical protein